MHKQNTQAANLLASQHQLAFFSMREVQAFLGGKSRSSVYRWIAAGEFPQPIKIGGNSSVWSLEDLIEWRDSVVSKEKQNA